MSISGRELEQDAADGRDGVRKVVNAAAQKKREQRLAREAAAKKRGR